MGSRLPLDSSLGALLLQHAAYVVACAEVEILAHKDGILFRQHRVHTSIGVRPSTYAFAKASLSSCSWFAAICSCDCIANGMNRFRIIRYSRQIIAGP